MLPIPTTGKFWTLAGGLNLYFFDIVMGPEK